MSAIRGNDRRATRSANSSPYPSARRLTKKKSSWTFGIGGLLSYINPLRPKRSSDPDEDEDTSDFEDIDGRDVSTSDDVPSSTDTIMRSPDESYALENPQIAQNPAASLSMRGHQLTNNINGTQQTLGQMLSTPPRVISSSPPDDANLSPAESLEKVQKFLKEKNGQALSEWETRGLLTFLEKNVQNDNEKPEPFRFSSSPLRTPARGNSPVSVFGSQGASPATDGDGTTPRKTLSKNPNGVYRWQGAGSARPRNRYQSPSFGTRSPPPTIKLSPKTDIKRRRVGEDTNHKSASQTVPFPIVSPQKPINASASTPAPSQTRPFIFPPVNGTDAAQNGASSSSSKTNGTTAPRLRTSGLPTKPTAPSVPSPLRQTWGQSDSPPHTPASRPNSTPTRAANFMTELIKDVTPPKRPDVSNPYQTASPVKPPARKPVVKKPRVSTKPPAPLSAPAKTSEPSPQAIIEATLPKGSKRSRPPPDLLKSTRANTIPAPALAAVPSRRPPRTPTLDLPSVNGSSSVASAKRNPKSSPMIVEEIDDDGDDRVAKKQKTTFVNESAITVEEIDDVDMALTLQPSGSLFSQSAEVIEPDAGISMADHTGFPASSTAISPIKSTFGLKSSAPKEPSKLRFSYKSDASPPLVAAVPVSPSPFFAPPPTPKFSHAKLPSVVPTISRETVIVDRKQVVIAMAVHDLPTYSFLQPGFGARAGIDHLEGTRAAAKAVPTLSLPTFDFSVRVTDAGRSTPSTFSSSKPVAPITKGFDWAAAGLKAPSATGTWTCSLCMLSNPATANKCTVCETLH